MTRMPKHDRPALRRALPIAGATAIGVVCLLLASGFQANQPEPALPPEGIAVEGGAVHIAPGAPQWQSIRLESAEEAARTWSDPSPARVRIDERRAARVGSPLPGRVMTVHVDLGERVEKGAPLFTVSSRAIAELRADARRASTELALARRTRERVAALVEAKAIPAKEALLASQQEEQAEVAHRSAREQLAALQVVARDGGAFTVVAPRSGVVVEKAVLPNQEVTPEAEPLLTIAETDTLWVVADLLAADAIGIREGATARVAIPSLPEVEIEGVVERVSAVVDPIRNTVPVRILVENEAQVLLPNLFVQASFDRGADAGAVEIPASAVVTDGARQFVFVQEEEGRFVRREVVARSARNGRMPVIAGLRARESVVSRGAVLLGNHLSLTN